jgi:hypothetical protein
MHARARLRHCVARPFRVLEVVTFLCCCCCCCCCRCRLASAAASAANIFVYLSNMCCLLAKFYFTLLLTLKTCTDLLYSINCTLLFSYSLLLQLLIQQGRKGAEKDRRQGAEKGQKRIGDSGSGGCWLWCFTGRRQIHMHTESAGYHRWLTPR